MSLGLEEGDLVQVVGSRKEYNWRKARITEFHLKDVGIQFVDDGDRISLRYNQIMKLKDQENEDANSM